VVPESDFNAFEAKPRQDLEPNLEVTLSSWIVEAIDRGEYQPEQVQKLVEQKIGVKRAIFAQARLETSTSSRSSEDESTNADYSTFSTFPTTLDEELDTAEQEIKHDGLLGFGSRTASAPRMSVQLDICNWKVMHDPMV
jgi:hypothetical protein